MGRMDTKTLRNISALMRRDLADALHNPTMLMMAFACVAMSWLFARIAETGVRLAPGEGAAFLFTGMLVLAPAFVGCVGTLYVMAEERERGMHTTLVEAGVTPVQYTASKFMASLALTLATEVLTLAVTRTAPAPAAALLVFSVVAVLPVLFMGLAGGLSATEQMSSSVLAIPITLVAVAPILAFVSDGFHAVSWVLPMGPAGELLRAACGLEPAASPALLVVLAIVWTVVTGALAMVAYRRFVRDLAAARDRLL